MPRRLMTVSSPCITAVVFGGRKKMYTWFSRQLDKLEGDVSLTAVDDQHTRSFLAQSMDTESEKETLLCPIQ